MSNSNFDKNGVDSSGTHWYQYLAFGFTILFVVLIWLYFRDVNYIREAYPDRTVAGAPQHYALYDNDSFIVAPTPNLNLTVELHYFYKPASITAGAEGGTTWLSENATNALLYGCLIEGYVYMKGAQDMLAEYEKRYFQAISRLKNLGEADNTIDTYAEGMLRQKRT